MGIRWATVSTSAIIASPAAAAETVIATLPGISPAIDGAQVLVQWYATITIGTNGTALTVRLRRGTTAAGTLVNVASALDVTAAKTVLISGMYFDSPGIYAGQQYSLTVLVTAASAGSTVNDVAMYAMIL